MTKAVRRLFLELAAFAAIACALGAAAEGAYRASLYLHRADPAAEGAFLLYGVGESTMRGEPDEKHLAPPYVVRALLGGRIQGRDIVIRQLAAGGASMYPQSHELRQALAYRDRNVPGAVLIYTGHNEEPLEAGAPLLLRVYEWLKENILDNSYLASDLLLDAERSVNFRGYRSLGTYEFYLRRTIEACLRSGLTPILSPAIGNIRDWEPGLFFNDAGSRDRVLSAIGPGLKLESQGRWNEAIAVYEQSPSKDPQLLAFFFYRLARCEERLGRYAAAREHYWAAVDADRRTNQRRANREQIALVRRLASQYAVPLVDAPSLFEGRSAHGIPGADLFLDGHHPNLEGYLLLGKAYAQALSRLSGEPLKERAETAADLCRLMPIDGERRSRILMDRGWTAASYCFGHAFPERRLRLAESDFKGALALNSGDLGSWLGLSLVEAARREPRLLQDDEERGWLATRGLPLEPGRGACPPSDLSEVAARFKSLGVPASLLGHLSGSAQAAAQCEALREENPGGTARP